MTVPDWDLVMDRIHTMADGVCKHRREMAEQAIRDAGGEVTEERVAELLRCARIRLWSPDGTCVVFEEDQ